MRAVGVSIAVKWALGTQLWDSTLTVQQYEHPRVFDHSRLTFECINYGA